MENREYLNSLFDIYGELLTKVERVTFLSYYKEDLSLNEIAENRHISKSSVGKTLNQAEEKLQEYERLLKVKRLKQELTKILEEESNNNIKERLTQIINL